MISQKNKSQNNISFKISDDKQYLAVCAERIEILADSPYGILL